MRKLFFLVIMLAVAAMTQSCKDNAEDVAPQTTSTVSKDATSLFTAKDPALAAVVAAGTLSNATAASPQCEGWSNSDKASYPTDFLNSNKVFTDFTGGMVIGGPKPVREVLPLVPTAEQDKAYGFFFNAFDCSKVATFSSLVWTKVGDQLVAGYFLDKTTSVSYTLIKGRDYTYNYDFVRVSCNQQTNVDGVVIPNTLAAFSIKYAVVPSGSTPVVTPPATGGGTAGLADFVTVTATDVTIAKSYQDDPANVYDGGANGHYSVWNGLCYLVAPKFDINVKGNMFLTINGAPTYNSAFDGFNYAKFRAIYGIGDNITDFNAEGFTTPFDQTRAALGDLQWTEISNIANAKAFKATKGGYTFKTFKTNNKVAYYGKSTVKDFYIVGFFVEDSTGKVIFSSFAGSTK